MDHGPSLVYVADPMCSWCWGFYPVVESISERFGARAPISVLLGGLAPGTANTMDEQAKVTVREHWDHVHEATGQPFDYAFFDREQFTYDTEPPSRAVVTARRLRPDSAVPFLAHVHAAFYRDNRDVTAPDTLWELAAEFGFDRDEFERAFADEETGRATTADFALARELGIRGFPSLIGHYRNDLTAITMGYRPVNAIGRTIETWLEGVDSQSR